MSSVEKIKKLFAKSNISVDSEVDDRIVRDTLKAFDESKDITSFPAGLDRWRVIMNTRITKLAVAVVIMVTAILVINYLGGSVRVSSVAFGDILQKILDSSYTFEVTTIGDVKDETFRGMILQSAGLRIDSPEEGISSVTNFNTGQGLVLFHRDKIAITELPDTENQVDSGPFAFFLNSIENLWNLSDGTEKSLGEKEIDGHPALGFEVRQNNEEYISDIEIWAHKETGAPIWVEITLHDPENIHSVTMVMSQFDLDAELDEELFSTEPPEDYKVTTYQRLREDPASVYRQP